MDDTGDGLNATGEDEEPGADAYADEDAAEEWNAEPDVLLDVPHLQVEEITLDVENLKARVSLQADVLDLVKLHVGAEVELGSVHLDIKGVEAQALLKVRLDNVTEIIGRVLTTIDRNPGILRDVTSAVGPAVQEAGAGVGRAVDEAGRGVGRAVADVGEGTRSAVGEVGRGAGKLADTADSAAGSVVDEGLSTAGRTLAPEDPESPDDRDDREEEDDRDDREETPDRAGRRPAREGRRDRPAPRSKKTRTRRSGGNEEAAPSKRTRRPARRPERRPPEGDEPP
ncbi:hypothetical protein [Streptomyces sp. t39]|uniref:hypothetical protein n=1 Tax=Streptomyces sp. t39 TaxID=1828156 RepID=UPI0011CDAAAE|nr:hypothetical protein [Streptomyces sp. t39]TXS52031.1 hypothetical protein EAO77_21945 [Streptomyces sp. t39]